MSKKWLLGISVCVLCLGGCDNDSSGNADENGVCGNSEVEGNEVCDDGNTAGGDGCAADCSVVESGYRCPPNGGSCEPIEEPGPQESPVCGNSKVETSEVCDDGNTDDGDGCSSHCDVVESGFDCPSEGGACVVHVMSKCGDGDLNDGEICDDGNTEDGDGCAADCSAVEAGYDCPAPGVDCIFTGCGNGQLDDGEACDDGNNYDGDGCTADCSIIEDGYDCPIPGTDCIPFGCGNGTTEENESCDPGQFPMDYGVGECTVSCTAAHYCGDSLLDEIDIQNGEECDAGEDTSSQYNGCTAECKRVQYCGDGMVQPGNEKCDDGNSETGDGCSDKCEIEPNYVCVTSEGKSVCSSILCGNGALDSGEKCDDGNRISGDGCSIVCQVERNWRCTLDDKNTSHCVDTCGDSKLDSDTGETCDDGNEKDGDGCSSSCTVENGYVCEGAVCLARACGDGVIAGNEECDDGNAVSMDGCSKFCKREAGWHCDAPGMPCAKDACGDGVVTGDETCDEGGNQTEGCVNCKIQLGWQCLTPGAACTNDAECGNGKMEGAEQCEENSECCVGCLIQSHCACDKDGKNCVLGYCGNGLLEYGEACDDGNDNAGDGCSPACTKEPIFDCIGGTCKPVCGDGLALTSVGEECDDGNLVNGDGCSSDCKVEKGFVCLSPDPTETPDTINLAVTYRDVIRWQNTAHEVPATTSPMTDGYLSQEMYDSLPDSCKGTNSPYRGSFSDSLYTQLTVGRPNPDFTAECNNGWCKDVVLKELGPEGVPVLGPAENFKNQTQFSAHVRDCKKLYTCPEVFRWWFMDVPGINRTIKKSIPLTKKGDVYEYINNSYWPLGGDEGYGKEGSNNSLNGEFTGTSKTYFRYKGGEQLTFNGDDDVWIYFNGILGVELAGIHGKWTESITLDTKSGAEKFHMYPGGIYPIHIFQAERCTGSSTFQLTLSGFVNMGESTCSSICGDGVVRGAEECDPIAFANPANPTPEELEKVKVAGCGACKLVPYCGNGKIEKGEHCDTNEAWCVECKIPTCGNGELDAHEECDGDKGVSAGQTCLDTCRISGCGDGVVAENEECDDGNLSDDDMCTSKCALPRCGDGIISSAIGEVCDDGINDGTYGGCGLGCTYIPPRCGDGVFNADEGEECDNGEANNIGGYGGCKADCKLDIRCGDKVLQPELEQCDEGVDNGSGTCSQSCTLVIN